MMLDPQILRLGNMTHNQFWMYIGQRMAGRKPILKIGIVIEIARVLDPPLFCESFDYVVAKSDTLRSVFRFTD